jgi:hypothetical protein
MAKFKFSKFYGNPILPQELIIEAADEDQAWGKFEKQVIQPVYDAFTCEEVENDH